MYEQTAKEYEDLTAGQIALLVEVVRSPVWEVLRDLVYRPEEDKTEAILRRSVDLHEMLRAQGGLYVIESFWHDVEDLVRKARDEEVADGRE